MPVSVPVTLGPDAAWVLAAVLVALSERESAGCDNSDGRVAADA